MIKPLPKPTKKILLAAIILVGVFFRLHQINELPPGDGYDPAFYGLDALRILEGEHPIYLATNFGREAMFSYVVATTFLLFGPGTLGIHTAAVLIAVITIPSVYLVADEFFKLEKKGAVRWYGGVVAALILAISYWHLNWSRYGVRAIFTPLFVSLTIFFLLRGLRKGSWGNFAAAGVVLGLSLYTYQIAQLIPLLVFSAFLYDIIARPSFGKQDALRLLLLFGIAGVLALPLAYYAYSNPGVFNQRVQGVYILRDSISVTAQIQTLMEQGWRVLLMFVYQGDSSPTINLPFRPVLNPFLSLFFITGILISLWRWRRPRYLFLLTWLVVMIAPSLLADKAALSKRALGALPATMLLISLGLLWPLDALLRRKGNMARKWIAAFYSIAIFCGLVFTAYITYQDYFIQWGSISGLKNDYDLGVKEIGQYISTLPEEETIYLSPTWGEHASLRLHSKQRDGIRAYNGRHCFAFPQKTESETNYIIVPEDDRMSLSLLPNYFPQGQVLDEGILENSDPYFTVYEIPTNAPAQFTPQFPIEANWENKIKLLGYDLEVQEYASGEDISLNLYYQPLSNMRDNYTVFVHLWGEPDPESGNIIYGQRDREPCFDSYPTSYWQPSEVIQDTFTFSIMDNAEPGAYQLATGIYKWPELTRLPLAATDAASEGDAVILRELMISK